MFWQRRQNNKLHLSGCERAGAASQTEIIQAEDRFRTLLLPLPCAPLMREIARDGERRKYPVCHINLERVVLKGSGSARLGSVYLSLAQFSSARLCLARFS